MAIARVLDRLVDMRGAPLAIRLDNDSELLATQFVTCCERRAIELRYIQPGTLDQNAFIERFNRSYHDVVLNAYVFADLNEVRQTSREWLMS